MTGFSSNTKITRIRWILLLGLLPFILSLSQPQKKSRPASQQQQHHTSRERRQESISVGHHPLLSLNLNLDALARAQAPERAQELFQRISALYKEGYYAVAPDVVSFNSVLKAWQSDPERALEFWEQELGVRDDDDEEEDEEIEGSRRTRQRSLCSLLEPNVRSYNTFLLALARAGLADPAEMLLRQMQDPHSLVLPDRITYNTVLLAFSFTRDPNAPLRAEALLNEMFEADSPVRPDVVSFNTVLSAWANIGTRAAAQKAHDWLDEMSRRDGIRPDVYSYTTVIQAFARCGASQNALQLLRSMNQEDAMQHADHHKKELQPNKVTYTVVMQALCRDRQPQAAQDLLNEMIQKARQGSLHLRPDVVAFSALMDGYVEQADRQPLETIKVVFQLLQQMKDLAKIEEWPDVMPNQRTYTSVLSALAQSRQWEAGPHAEEILDEMRAMGVTPTVIHWNAVLNAYAKSPRANKILHARRIWENLRMQSSLALSSLSSSSSVAPDAITYNTLLSVAANSFGKDDTIRKSCLQMGFDIFRTLQEDPNCLANSLTFHYLIKVIRKFLPPSEKRWQVIQRIFDLCCQQGCLNEHILQQLFENMDLSEQQMKTLLGEDYWIKTSGRPPTSLSGLPLEWSQHALTSLKLSGKRQPKR